MLTKPQDDQASLNPEKEAEPEEEDNEEDDQACKDFENLLDFGDEDQVDVHDEDDDEEDGDHQGDTPRHEEGDLDADDTRQFVCVGMVGHPNAGKSSLINALKAKKVVSTSRSPGHTKHFQTILLERYLCGVQILLCDSPGLVFPALNIPKPLQVLCGLFPIAQTREPYSAIRILAGMVPLEKMYNLWTHLDPDDKENPAFVWTPYAICEAFARFKGMKNARSGAPDTHRAALALLRDAVDGSIVMNWPPPRMEGQDFAQEEEGDEGEEEEEEDEHQTERRGKVKQATPAKTLLLTIQEETQAAKEKPLPKKLSKKAQRARDYADKKKLKQVAL